MLVKDYLHQRLEGGQRAAPVDCRGHFLRGPAAEKQFSQLFWHVNGASLVFNVSHNVMYAKD